MQLLQLLAAASSVRSARLVLHRGLEEPAPLLPEADFSNPQAESLTDALNFSSPDVPTVPLGADLEAAAQELDTSAAAALATPQPEGASPTYAPLDGRVEETATLADYQDAAADAIAGKKDDVARLDLDSCGCECCMGIRRPEPKPTSNFTCTPVPDYLVPDPALPTDNVAPPADHGSPTAPAICRGVEIAECGSRAHGADTDEVLEALTYASFCGTHCRAVDDHVTTPCVALDGSMLDAAWHDGAWTDPLLPSVAEEQSLKVQAAESALLPEPDVADPGDKAAMDKAEPIVDALSSPVAAAAKALEHANAVFAG